MAFLGAIVSAVGMFAQGSAQAAADKYQAQVAENNKIIAEQNAVYELQAGQTEEQAQRIKTSQVLGQAEAVQSASGIDASRGSAVKVRKSTAVIGELDALNIRDNAARRAYGYRAEGVNFAAQAGLYRMQAKSDMMGGILGGLGSLIGGFSSLSGKWGSMQSPAAGGTSEWNAFESTGPSPNTLLQYTLPRY